MPTGPTNVQRSLDMESFYEIEDIIDDFHAGRVSLEVQNTDPIVIVVVEKTNDQTSKETR